MSLYASHKRHTLSESLTAKKAQTWTQSGASPAPTLFFLLHQIHQHSRHCLKHSPWVEVCRCKHMQPNSPPWDWPEQESEPVNYPQESINPNTSRAMDKGMYRAILHAGEGAVASWICMTHAYSQSHRTLQRFPQAGRIWQRHRLTQMSKWDNAALWVSRWRFWQRCSPGGALIDNGANSQFNPPCLSERLLNDQVWNISI